MGDLAAPGATSAENQGFIGLFSSLGDAIRGIGETLVDVTDATASTVRGIEDAINPPNSSTIAYESRGGENIAQASAPESLKPFLTNDNLLIGGGIALGLIGLIIALRG
jgi:hypothetical protein